jgi:hypothetical protein
MSCCLWDQRLDWTLHPYQYAVTVHENRYVTYLPLSSSTYLYHPLPTSFILYLPLSSSIILYLPLSSSTYLYHPLPTSIILYLPLPTSIILYHPLLPTSITSLPTTSILVYAVLTSSINYDIIVTVYKNASRDVCRLELHHVDASIHLSPREIDELYHCTQVLCSRHSQLHMVRFITPTVTIYHSYALNSANNSHSILLFSLLGLISKYQEASFV